MMKHLLEQARVYVEWANHTAEARHDAPGEYYMDGGQYEIMKETEELLKQIDLFLSSPDKDQSSYTTPEEAAVLQSVIE